MTRAAELHLYVCKPWGESAPYDFAVDHRGRFLRVQVKCTIYCRGNSYKCHLDTNGVPYDPRDLDFFAAYVIPTDTWYLLPIRATNRQPDILLPKLQILLLPQSLASADAVRPPLNFASLILLFQLAILNVRSVCVRNIPSVFRARSESGCDSLVIVTA